MEGPADAVLAHQGRANHLLVPRGRFDEAAACLELAGERDPLSISVAASRAALLCHRGEFARCVFACRPLQERGPGCAPGDFFEGLALLASGDAEDALDAFRRARRRSGGSVETGEPAAGPARTSFRTFPVEPGQAGLRDATPAPDTG